jgi:hypothetical protein
MFGKPLATGPVDGPVPVFNCHVLLTKPTAPGELWTARCATAATITADGSTERDVLQKMASRFKFFVHEHHVRGESIPWTTPPLSPAPGELERFFPVHL